VPSMPARRAYHAVKSAVCCPAAAICGGIMSHYLYVRDPDPPRHGGRSPAHRGNLVRGRNRR
jgi:hypothetical protein